MTVTVALTDPRSDDALRLLQASHDLMSSLYAADGCHFLSVDQLCVPTVRFFTASVAGKTLGCGALKVYDTYGEVKSMFVDTDARGQGVAEALLTTVLDTARTQNLPKITLETGHGLDAAHRLYFRHGFALCGPFGDYIEHPDSLFMEKPL